MTSAELRAKYLAFFESKGHSIFPSGSLVPIDVTGRLDESLLFNGAGMVQFKPYFRGVATPKSRRLTTSQKCVRTGDIESVGDLSHLTFFEMLGNFSFGDYFKEEAIQYSWEFLTDPQWLGLDPKRLAFTVFEVDDEAFTIWSDLVSSAGLNPDHRIFRLDEETNYWPAGAFSHGPPGPCGPNSEMFYWVDEETPMPTGPYTREEYLRDDDAKRWLEIWNDVFIQYEWQGELKDPSRPDRGFKKTGMPELPFKSIDTGMGLERTSAVLSGFQSVYEIDSFQAILGHLSSIAGHRYGSDETTDHAMRIIADHARTASFCIAEDVTPSNNGRGYVLRRLIRRAVLKGRRTLGISEPFFHEMLAPIAQSMGAHYGELRERTDFITRALHEEEEQFLKTLHAGSNLLTNHLVNLQSGDRLDGRTAFMLYDTYGFPLEVTREISAENGISVDEEGYETALREAQERSRGASGMETVYGGVTVIIRPSTDVATKFLGYETTQASARILGVMPQEAQDGGWTDLYGVALDQTPFYAESGGQLSDHGFIDLGSERWEVLDVEKSDGVFVHLVKPNVSLADLPDEEDARIMALNSRYLNQMVNTVVNPIRRANIVRNHTATHLLQAGLQRVVGDSVKQKGSQVAPDSLRFDFSHSSAVTPAELKQVEDWVNAQILDGFEVRTLVDVPLAEAKAMGAMALFGERYADKVRVVAIHDDLGNPVSVELCGGIHVPSTSHIGLFKILHESSAAGGVRRIVAVTGAGARAWANEQHDLLLQSAELLKSNPQDLPRAIKKLQDQLKEERKKAQSLAAQEAKTGDFEQVGPVKLAVRTIDGIDPKEAQVIADRLVENEPNGLAVVVVKGDGKVTFIAKAGKQAPTHGVHAGNLVKELATRTSGGGGGRPDFATAGGRDLSRLDDAVQAIPSLVNQMVNTA